MPTSTGLTHLPPKKKRVSPKKHPPPTTSPSLSQKQNFPVFRQRPFLVVNKQLELVNVVTDLVKKLALHLVAISDCLIPTILNLVSFLSRFNHFFDAIAYRCNMLRNLVKDLSLIFVRRLR